jgi:hypothetical protein
VAANEAFSRRHVRMIGRFCQGQDRRKADVGAFHDGAPFVACPGPEHIGKPELEHRPRAAIHLRVEAGVRKAGPSPQQRVEFWFGRADRNEVTATALIDAIEVRAAIEKIALALVGPLACRGQVKTPLPVASVEIYLSEKKFSRPRVWVPLTCLVKSWLGD